ncbi:hypothetical protein CU664_09270 [Pseudomonas syringae pv. actinidifoliorum]|nr:hypothetical protein [Pseudomonas syringae pv. actinidifoliorum]NAT63462.1 hypothetical protein [Pseudomonas syringae pv. actinidifoliorum]
MHVGSYRLFDRFDLDILGCAVTYLLVGFSAESVLKARQRASTFVSHFLRQCDDPDRRLPAGRADYWQDLNHGA